MSAARVRPAMDDRDTAGFWAAAASGTLAISVCSYCAAVIHLPMSVCHRCRGGAVEWRPVAGKASLYSWTTIWHQTHPAFPVPYTIVLVELDDEPEVRLLGHLPGEADLQPGMPMELRFEDLGEGVVLPQWVPSGGPSQLTHEGE